MEQGSDLFLDRACMFLSPERHHHHYRLIEHERCIQRTALLGPRDNITEIYKKLPCHPSQSASENSCHTAADKNGSL